MFAVEDGVMTDSTNYAILGQRKLHMEELAHVRGHNAREQEVANAMPGGPEPVVVFGDPDTPAAVKARLAELGVKPNSNAVVALEQVMTTSPEWWRDLSNRETTRMQCLAFQKMARRYLEDRFPAEALISMVWHLDEQTPHLHAIACPLQRKADGRRRDGVQRWTLNARGDLHEKDLTKRCRASFGDRGQMAREQTIFAQTLAPLKLVRGKEWSGAPNKPNAVWQAELRAAVAAAEAERDGLALARQEVALERVQMAVDRATVAEHEQAAVKAREVAEADRVAAVKVLAEARAAAAATQRQADGLVARAADLAERERAFEARRAEANAWRDSVIAARDRYRSGLAELSEVEADAIAVHEALRQLGVENARQMAPAQLIQRLLRSIGDAEAKPAFARDLRLARAGLAA